MRPGDVVASHARNGVIASAVVEWLGKFAVIEK
jgi:hypothetical protein